MRAWNFCFFAFASMLLLLVSPPALRAAEPAAVARFDFEGSGALMRWK